MNKSKVVILAGGYGTRFLEETQEIPKALIRIGNRPILRHLMDFYASQGFQDFIIALGYRGEQIRQYFADNTPANWNVTLVDTGLETQTGGRLKRLAPYLDSTFHLTWSDGLSDIPLQKLSDFHKEHGKMATVTAVRPPLRFGYLQLKNDQVTRFEEKPKERDRWIQGAFFILEPKIFDYIEGDQTQFECGPLQQLTQEHQLMAYKHDSFWHCMDTLHDHSTLEALWREDQAPWKMRS